MPVPPDPAASGQPVPRFRDTAIASGLVTAKQLAAHEAEVDRALGPAAIAGVAAMSGSGAGAEPAGAAAGTAATRAEEPADPFVWLEEVMGERALEWVRPRNEASVAALASSSWPRSRSSA